LLIRVCCKLHNLCIEKCGSDRRVGIARGDARPGDIASALFTDGTGMFRGRRSDLESTETRNSIVRRLRELGITRPAHSKFSKVKRI
jgi:hypothetical protein